MKRFFIMMTLVLMIALVAMPMGLCWNNELPKAEVKLAGALYIPPVIRLKVNNTEAVAKGAFDYDREWANPMVLWGEYPEPGRRNKAHANSGNYQVDVYSNDDWSLFMWRTNIERIKSGSTEEPEFEYKKIGRRRYHRFPAGERVYLASHQSPTDNNYETVGNYTFRASYDAGSKPGFYKFIVGFVAYQE